MHEIIDSLPASELHAAGRYLIYLLNESEPVALNEEELAGLEQARASLDRGDSLSHAEVGELLNRWIRK